MLVPSVAVETITPSIAVEYLTKNTNNYRTLMPKVVDKYSRDMKAGAWSLTHQGIAFDTVGVLRDGQHRLHAVVKSETAVQMMVFRGIASDVDLDTGKRRKMSAIIQQEIQLKNSVNVISACNSIRDIFWGHRHELTKTEQIQLINKFKNGLDFAIENVTSDEFRRKVILGPVALAYNVNEVKLREFCRLLCDDTVGLPEDSPILSLRRYIHSGKYKQDAADSRGQSLKVLNTIYAYFIGGGISRLTKASELEVEWFAKYNDVKSE